MITKFMAATVLTIFAMGSVASAVETDSSGDTTVSRGGLFVEPLVELGRSDSKLETNAATNGFLSDTSGKNTSLGVGAKAGIHLSEMVFLGADVRVDQQKVSDSSYGDAQGLAWNYGVTGGLQTPYWGVRLLATYVLGGQFDPSAGSNGFDVKVTDPRGYRLGAGFHVRSIGINLEYEDLKYNHSDLQSIGGYSISQNTDIDYSTSGFKLSVSFPIEL